MARRAREPLTCHMIVEPIVCKGLSRGGTHLQALGDGGWGDKLEVLHLSEHTVICGLVEDDQVVKLLANLSLGPLLQAPKQQ